MLAHVATAEGIVAAETLAGESPTVDGQAIPAAVFTDPEIGTVGMTEDEAADAGHEPVVGEMPLRGSGRAMTLDDTDGFVRLVADADGRILGCQVVGPHASELLGEVTLAIQTGATLADLATTIHTHPTLSGAVMEAAENARGQAIPHAQPVVRGRRGRRAESGVRNASRSLRFRRPRPSEAHRPR